MRKIGLLSFIFGVLLTLSLGVQAKNKPEKITKNLDFSGTYTCKGQDAHEGDYAGKVTMKLRPEHSKQGYNSYDFQLEVPDYGVYLGHAAMQGLSAAMHFALPTENGVYGGKTEDFGTGIAQFSRHKTGKWQFKKFYFEPNFKGGNTGLEQCVMQ